MQPFLVVAYAHRCIEQVAEARRSEELGTRTIPHNPASTHQDHPVNLGKNIAQVMRHQHQPSALIGKTAQCVAKLALGGEVKRVRGFIEEQLARPVDKGAGNEDAAFFAG
jgi:hypothetical protein